MISLLKNVENVTKSCLNRPDLIPILSSIQVLGTLSETVNIAALQQENTQLIATVASLTSELDSFKQQLDSHKQQLDWFKRQLFGRKSEKRLAF